MAKHIVTPTESFEHEFSTGTLVMGEVVIAPAEIRKVQYIAGQRIPFTSKKDADAFIKAHDGKMKYIGKE